jgi:uncharacterized protein
LECDVTTIDLNAETPLWLSLRRPWTVLVLALLAVVAIAAGVTRLHKDSSVDAFVPADHPAALARDEAKRIFGLEDPVLIGLATPKGETAFTPSTLTALRTIHDAVRQIPGVKKNGVLSIASQNAIFAQDGGLGVEPILSAGPVTADSAALAWVRVNQMPMLLDRLVSRRGDMLAVVVPLDDPNHAVRQVAELTRIARDAAPDGVTVHVAGVAAMNARLAHTVDSDTRIFVPAAAVVIIGILLIALRSAVALAGPILTIAGAAAITIGLMGWTGAQYYLITTALPIVVMAIAVADCLHIVLRFQHERRLHPDRDARRCAQDALDATILPVTLTSATTVAAFIGLSFGAAMQPISEFGLFAAAGVASAWALSLTLLPAILVLTNLKPKSLAPKVSASSPVDAVVQWISTAGLARPWTILGALCAVTFGLAWAASHARFDYERQRYFASDDPVRASDAQFAKRFGGVNFLDVVVTAPNANVVMTPKALSAIKELREQIRRLPYVSNVTGVDQYIGVMHAALTGASPDELPAKERAPAQYMFLYEASGAPEDFKSVVDYTYTRAFIRAQLSTDRFAVTKPVVRQLETLARSWSARHGLTAQVSGRIAVNEGWMSALASNHFIGLGLATILVSIATLVAFRAVWPATLAMLPVLTGIVFVYTVMGVFEIDIAPATSMTAAIATGLGVDFGIHLVAHIRRQLQSGQSLETALAGEFLLVGRACVYSTVSLGAGLSVVALSSAPPLQWFGVLVAAGAAGSLFGALFLVPSLMAIAQRNQSSQSQGAVSNV